MQRKSSQSFKVSLSFPERWFCIRRPNLTLERLEPIFSGSEDSIYAFYRLQNKFIENPDILRNFPGMFNVCFTFPEKWFCIPRANFAFFIQPFTNIQSYRRFDLGFFQTSEQVYRKLQHGEKIFAKFQSEPRFPRKMVWYSLTKFGIIKT